MTHFVTLICFYSIGVVFLFSGAWLWKRGKRKPPSEETFRDFWRFFWTPIGIGGTLCIVAAMWCFGVVKF